jgi:uncharacterized spore protein YtfJ
MTEDEARERARREAGRGDFVARLAERLGASAGASAVFGDPVERDGVTVIPVARAAWGFGGGEGEEGEREGQGGGGGAIARPQGYIEISGGEARYRPLRDPLAAAAVVAAGALVAGAVALLRRRG